MNDLDLVRLVGQQIPPTDEESRQRARSRLMELVEAEARGAGRVPDIGRRWPRAAILGVAATLILIGILMVLPRGSGYATADELFADLRGVAVDGTSEPVGPSEFLYTRFEQVTEHGDGAGSTLIEGTREIWIARDGAGRIRDGSGDEVFQAGELLFIDTDALPADPDTLEAMLRQGEVFGGTPPTEVDLLADIGSLLAESHPRPELSAALFQVAGRIPGVELVGDRTDALGRKGIAVALADTRRRAELVFDPDSARLLERSAVRFGDNGTEHLEYRITYERSGVVDSVEDLPG